MEVEFDDVETEVGEIEIPCPLCNGDGYLYAKKTDTMQTLEIGEATRVEVWEYDKIQCPCCATLGKLMVDGGTTYCSGSTEIDPTDWNDLD